MWNVLVHGCLFFFLLIYIFYWLILYIVYLYEFMKRRKSVFYASWHQTAMTIFLVSFPLAHRTSTILCVNIYVFFYQLSYKPLGCTDTLLRELVQVVKNTTSCASASRYTSTSTSNTFVPIWNNTSAQFKTYILRIRLQGLVNFLCRRNSSIRKP